MNTDTSTDLARLAEMAGTTEAEMRAFIEMAAAFGVEAHGSGYHAVRLAAANEERCFTRYMRDPQYRRTANATLGGTYDEFRTEANA